MADSTAKKTTSKSEPKRLAPLLPTDVALAEHGYRRFSVTVPGTLTSEDIERPDLWVSAAQKMMEGDEVRVLADDYSFVATFLVMFRRGSQVRLKLMYSASLDDVDRKAIAEASQDDFEIKLRGPKRWSIIHKESGEVVKEDILTELEARRELEDYKKALKL